MNRRMLFTVSLILTLLLFVFVISSAFTTVPVKSITLEQKDLTLYEGQVYQLKAAVSPENATKKKLTWSSGNTKVVNLDYSNNLLAVKPGRAVITVKSADGKVTVKCNVTVFKKVTLSYWGEFLPSGSYTDFGEMPFAKQVEKDTGVKIKYLTFTYEQYIEMFNLMIASGEIPDMIEYDWPSSYPGGLPNAYKNGLILKLNDYIDKYSPNYKKILATNEMYNRMIKADDGSVFSYATVRANLRVWNGLMVRADWLKDLKLTLPETLDDWYNMLKTFKGKKGATAPLAVQGGNIHAGFYVPFKMAGPGLYIDENGKVQHSAVAPGQKDFLTTMAKWYSEGLIHKEFPTATAGTVTDNLLFTGKSGAIGANLGGGLRRFLDTMKQKDPNSSFDLAATKWPVMKKGDKPFCGQMDFPYFSGYDTVITTQCKNPEAAARFLDYAYSERGHMLYNFGVEGLTYKKNNDGSISFTQFVNKNPKGQTADQVLAIYRRMNGAFENDDRATMASYVHQQQKDAVVRWSDTDAMKHLLPPLSFIDSETKTLAEFTTSLDTYVKEMTAKFICGVEPISNYDKYVEQLKKMGIDKVIKCNQDAYDRYMKR